MGADHRLPVASRMNSHNLDRTELDIVPGLRREWIILARRRWLILTTTLLAVGGAGAYNYGVRPLYQGAAIISAREAVPGQPNARLNADLPRLRIVIEQVGGHLRRARPRCRVSSTMDRYA